jgi:sulfate adenylyltransferase subunit 1
MLCWMSRAPLQAGAKLLLRHTTLECTAAVRDILYTVDINSLHREEGVQALQMNDIARVRLRTAKPLLYDPYRKNRQTGSIILVDPGTYETVAAGMLI